jgi:hypothetical protein
LATRPTLAVLSRFASISPSVGASGLRTHSFAAVASVRRENPKSPRDQSRALLTWPHRRRGILAPLARLPPIASRSWAAIHHHCQFVPGRRVTPRPPPNSFPGRCDCGRCPCRIPYSAAGRAPNLYPRVPLPRALCRQSLNLYANRVFGTYFDHVVDSVPVASAYGSKGSLPIAMTVPP